MGGCIYCDSLGSGSGAIKKHSSLKTQALAGMQFLAKRYKAKKFIAYFQSFSNTYAPTEQLRLMYDEVAKLPGIVGLSVATRPDCLSQETLELLASYSDHLMVWLELGMQTSHDKTLKTINRGHTYKDFLDGYCLARKYPLLICLHVIIGLPGEGEKDIMNTAREIASLKPDGIKIHSLYIHKDTHLETLFNEKKYVPLKQNKFAELTCNFLSIIPTQTIIHRLTGDPDPSRLIAPAWALEKRKTLAMIEDGLIRKNKTSKHDR